jgi:hypothetical protein
MKVVIISVGKKHDAQMADAINEYCERVGRVVSLSWEFIAPSGFDEPKARRQESLAISAKLKPNDVVWLLDERGKQLTSPNAQSCHTVNRVSAATANAKNFNSGKSFYFWFNFHIIFFYPVRIFHNFNCPLISCLFNSLFTALNSQVILCF